MQGLILAHLGISWQSSEGWWLQERFEVDAPLETRDTKKGDPLAQLLLVVSYDLNPLISLSGLPYGGDYRQVLIYWLRFIYILDSLI